MRKPNSRYFIEITFKDLIVLFIVQQDCVYYGLKNLEIALAKGVRDLLKKHRRTIF